LNKFDIGFVTYHPDQKVARYIISCGCGTVRYIKEYRWHGTKCEKCRCTNIVNLTDTKRAIFPYIEVISKDRKGFKAKRTNLSVFYDDDYNVCIKENMIQILIFDLANRKMKYYKNGENVELPNRPYHILNEDILKKFFHGANADSRGFLKKISVAETEELFNFAWNEEAYIGYSWNGNRRVWKALSALLNKNLNYIQVLSSAGFPNVERFYKHRHYKLNMDGTNPKDILCVPKFIIKYIRENPNVGMYEIEQIRKALEKVDGNRFRQLLEIVKDESTVRELCRTLDCLVEVHDTYGYNNLKKLTLYLFRELRMTQGIEKASEGATLLRDYISMATKLGQEYEKYPKSLKKNHDITMMNYQVQKNEMKKKEFSEVVDSEEYKGLAYKKKIYSIVTPKEMDDLIKEGSDLSHCVASYVDSILSKKCKILFLRKSEDVENPFATIEVRGINVRQARGFANRALKKDERDFISEWAKKKDLEVNYYY
jgi:hypothetical protein